MQQVWGVVVAGGAGTRFGGAKQFALLGGRPLVEGIPLMQSPSVSGFRTYAVGHPDYWRRLQETGAAPKEIPYEDVPRGRVNYEDGSGRFTLFADLCIVKSTRLVSRLMSKLCLPRNTRIGRDDHYKCARCMGKVPTRQMEKEDYDF